MSIDANQLKRIIEGALLAAGQPLDNQRIMQLFMPEESLLEEECPVTGEEIQAALESITADCEGRGFELKKVASGWRFQVREETAPWVNRLWEEKPQRYSRAMLETLALIAYRQPITRGDIEEIRGVAVSSHIIKTLTEREWVKVVGHRDVPGRPALYATTRTFLDYFNLNSLDELPSLGELADLDQLNPELNLGDMDIIDEDSESESVDAAITADNQTIGTGNETLIDGDDWANGDSHSPGPSTGNDHLKLVENDSPDSVAIEADTSNETDFDAEADDGFVATDSELATDTAPDDTNSSAETPAEEAHEEPSEADSESPSETTPRSLFDRS